MVPDPSSALPDRTSSGDGLWSPHRRALSLGLVFTITLLAFEALAIGTVMPAVSKELHGLELYGWAFAGFFLGDLVGIVVAGGLIDRAGLARPFVAGLVLFAVGLVICGIAPSMEVLVAGRFLQGLGAGAIPPTAVALGVTEEESKCNPTLRITDPAQGAKAPGAPAKR